MTHTFLRRQIFFGGGGGAHGYFSNGQLKRSVRRIAGGTGTKHEHINKSTTVQTFWTFLEGVGPDGILFNFRFVINRMNLL